MTTETKSPPTLLEALDHMISEGEYHDPEINGSKWCVHCDQRDGHAPDCAFIEWKEAIVKTRGQL